MTTTMTRRLRRLERIVNPPPKVPPRIATLVAPTPGAAPAACAQFAKEFAQVRRKHEVVILVDHGADDWPPGIEAGPGVVRCRDSMEAVFAKLGRMPSSAGNVSAMADLLRSLSGNVFRPASAAALPDSDFDDEPPGDEPPDDDEE